ncbi:hypothetical protein D1B33_06790 [Lysinibacillus yapensis]|uniref:Uncharacterized protein n=1 Tax=Ureibacillus yapensis TaxID=2304605 RepID=A0A396SHN6_9BACL|nr:hypothetical protein [Lysinibacillus yapensis]RHW38577.1 hypothetical protein D1B33_06790 [Lysinibacillus yapensis]
MEGIIMMVVLFIISSIINSTKKKNEHQKTMPPFNNQPSKQTFDVPGERQKKNGPRSLEDFANEVFQQLNGKSLKSSDSRVSSEQETEKEVETIPSKSTERASLNENRSTARLGGRINSNAENDHMKLNDIDSLIPANRRALVQAVITSEILAPPKAKRK